MIERLRTDVIAPAREAGYEKIWLVGISLGGLGASPYAAEHAADLQGLVRLAPFLGDPRIVREIAGAGGLGARQPDERTEGDYQRTAPEALARRCSSSASGRTPPPE